MPRSISVPLNVDLIDVGPDFALGHARDAEGIESIVHYSLPLTTH
jgi:hypothetical protein